MNLQDLHPVDHALTSVEPTNDPYKAQDFWVYFGQKNNLGLDYLQPLFERGSTTEAAARFFAEVHGTTLATEYWAWVKNQAFEKSIDLAGALRTICVVESSSDHAVIGSVIEVDYPSGGPEGPAFPVILGSLPGLTAEVVRITMRDEVGRTMVTAGEQQAGSPTRFIETARFHAPMRSPMACAHSRKRTSQRTTSSTSFWPTPSTSPEAGSPTSSR